MNKIISLLALALLFSVQAIKTDPHNTEPLELEIRSIAHAKVPLAIICLGQSTESLQAIAQAMGADLSFTEQFEVSIKAFDQIPSKQELMSLAQQGISLVIFLQRCLEDASIEWRLYDLQQLATIKGKRYRPNEILVRAQGHALADLLWPELTGQEGFFSSRIVYCKKVKGKGKRPVTHIMIADYDGSNEELLVKTQSLKFAPRWNRDRMNPLISYSECRRSNTLLAYTTLDGKRYRAADYDGINMLLSFSAAGDKAVYCSSRGRGHCQIYYCMAGVFKQITDNDGNNICPVLSADGNTIYYCTDDKRKTPVIVAYDLVEGKTEDLIVDGYCVSPALSTRANKLAYSKMVHGTLQIFVYSFKTKSSEQVTFSKGDKEECSWSPCGNYLLYSVCNGNKNRLVMLNLVTKKEQFITTESAECSYPSWSPIYEKFPVVMFA